MPYALKARELTPEETLHFGTKLLASEHFGPYALSSSVLETDVLLLNSNLDEGRDYRFDRAVQSLEATLDLTRTLSVLMNTMKGVGIELRPPAEIAEHVGSKLSTGDTPSLPLSIWVERNDAGSYDINIANRGLRRTGREKADDYGAAVSALEPWYDSLESTFLEMLPSEKILPRHHPDYQ